MDSIPNSADLETKSEKYWDGVDKEVIDNFKCGEQLFKIEPVNCIKIYTLENEQMLHLAVNYKKHFDDIFNPKGYDIRVHHEFEVVGSRFNLCVRNKKFIFFACPFLHVIK